MRHVLERTNPKGGPFIGVCAVCGTEDLKINQANEPCANPSNMTQEEALVLAVKGAVSGRS